MQGYFRLEEVSAEGTIHGVGYYDPTREGALLTGSDCLLMTLLICACVSRQITLTSVPVSSNSAAAMS
jgi:hypothetical protein